MLVGPSGCGKSTLLNTIAGLESISSGEIRIDGRTINDLHPSKRDIAMVFQSYALYPNMTVEQNMAFGMEMRGVAKPQRDKAVADVAKTLQIEHLLKRRPGQLSGGQRQRVAMGRALVRQPRVFLFDEPLSNLDAKLRVDMRVEIKRLHQQTNATIVYVTHDQIEAMTLATCIAVLKDGELQQVGTPYEVYNSPANLFVADFMGSPAMNLLDGKVTRDGGAPLIVLERVNHPPIVIPPPASADASKLVDGAKVIFGIRPEAVNGIDDRLAVEGHRRTRCRANPAKHRRAQTLRMQHQQPRHDSSAHRIAHNQRAPDSQVIEQPDHVVAHRLAAVRRRIVRLAAIPVTAAIERNDAMAPGQRRDPISSPVMLRTRREAMHQHDGLAAPLLLEMNLHAIGIEVSHR